MVRVSPGEEVCSTGVIPRELCVQEEMPVIEVVEVAEKPKEFGRMEFKSTHIEVSHNFLEVN